MATNHNKGQTPPNLLKNNKFKFPNKIYEIPNPDQYDKEFGFIVEYGLTSIEMYNKVKGHYFTSVFSDFTRL